MWWLQAADKGEAQAQYIITTFHPQLVEIATKAYGVAHSNRVSTIRSLSRDQALKFVKGDRSHGQRGGGGGGGVAKPAAAAVEDGAPPGKRQKENEASETNNASVEGVA